ncbi:MAG: rod shape-determining protein MreD [Candidatus Cloacimonetes bacterium]|nr:rod shape-determining protein MreD [Candidatus Cloacimonadota bacterium]MDD2506878.1 rod shape-determining protein MreD [Candidatus Cloacimonadota bacterium]MDD4560460.1 rod shape-determining protein MreD [Candidatus Cloacimonadota bacterium]
MILKGIYVFLGGLFLLYVQVLFMPALAIANVVPLILLPWLIYTVWKQAWELSLPVVFIIGLMYDTLNPSLFGLHALFFVLLAVLIDVLRIPFEQDSTVAKLIAIASTNLIFSLLYLLAQGLSWGFDAKVYRLAALGFLYNLIFSLLFFSMMQFISKLRIVVAHD